MTQALFSPLIVLQNFRDMFVYNGRDCKRTKKYSQNA